VNCPRRSENTRDSLQNAACTVSDCMLPFSMQWKRIDITDILLEQEKVMKA